MKQSELVEFENKLKELGYKKYVQNLKNEDYAYWKVFYDGAVKIYQVGVFFYDFSKFEFGSDRIGVQYECVILCDNRIDLSVSKDISIEDFEGMASHFYEAMEQFIYTTKPHQQ